MKKQLRYIDELTAHFHSNLGQDRDLNSPIKFRQLLQGGISRKKHLQINHDRTSAFEGFYSMIHLVYVDRACSGKLVMLTVPKYEGLFQETVASSLLLCFKII